MCPGLRTAGPLQPCVSSSREGEPPVRVGVCCMHMGIGPSKTREGAWTTLAQSQNQGDSWLCTMQLRATTSY